MDVILKRFLRFVRLLAGKRFWPIIFSYAGLILLGACDENTLEPNIIGDYQIYISANFNNVHVRYNAGEKSYLANAYRLFNTHDSLLTYTFAIEDINNSSRSYIEISINNYRAPYLFVDKDIDSTLKIGSYRYISQQPWPKNPKRLSEVSISWYNDFKEKYTTTNIDQKLSSFYITNIRDTIYSGTSGNVKLKKADINFNCLLFNAFYGDSIRITNGKAVAIF
jgi:hypothetical protein